jgi:hypothetical protein
MRTMAERILMAEQLADAYEGHLAQRGKGLTADGGIAPLAHGPQTGAHSHAHSSQGLTPTGVHTHSHGHEGDGSHDHHHGRPGPDPIEEPLARQLGARIQRALQPEPGAPSVNQLRSRIRRALRPEEAN